MSDFGITFASVRIAWHFGVPQQLVDAIFDGRLGRVHLQDLYYSADCFPHWAHYPKEGEKLSPYQQICDAVDVVIVKTREMAQRS